MTRKEKSQRNKGSASNKQFYTGIRNCCSTRKGEFYTDDTFQVV